MMSADINNKIEQLERAIKQLDSVKRHLLHNATEIKGQVQTTMSRHLEALRNREVWLLNQVDLVFSAKETVLQAQQARLNKMLGILQSTIGLTTESNMDTLLADTLQKLDMNLNDLNPEETAFFTFRADQSDLRDTILNYGYVDANGMPLTGAFYEPESETLPRHFEDYEGPDNHIFHKTFEDNEHSKERGIYVNIPKLSTKCEDWLLRPTTKTTCSESTPRFSFPPFSFSTVDWVRQKSPSTPTMKSGLRTTSSDASINDWLHEIKHSADPEDEDDFEIVENSGLSTGSTESYSSCSDVPTKTTTYGDLDLITLQFPSAVQTWLKGNKSTSEDKPENTYPQFFQHILPDPELWLMHQPEQKKVCEDCTLPVTTTDIECLGDRLATLTCTASPMANFYRYCPPDKQCWLASPNERIQLPPVNNVCKANELCESYEECVCSPHCGLQHIGITDYQQWLSKSAAIDDHTGGRDSCQKSEVNGFEKWLATCKPNHIPNTKIHFPYFEETTHEPRYWIQNRENNDKNDTDKPDNDKDDTNKDDNYKDANYKDGSYFNSIFKHDVDDDIWLSTNHNEDEIMTEESLTWNIVKEQHRKLDSSDWLQIKSNSQSHDWEKNKDYWILSQK